MVEIRVDLAREADGRMLASVPDLPGVMAYGATADEAVRKAKSIALQVLTDMAESGESLTFPASVQAPSVPGDAPAVHVPEKRLEATEL